ncbi:putative ATP-binding protein [Rosellinia necatrix]|uniref:Putative ATP-binding protein n=1 Tax=Rosellinia necatrix TaxID=77044 RepID=A0A1W2TCN8_ROSNE|nr:putative ATP-binding protein [Rosellinia necatrix]
MSGTPGLGKTTTANLLASRIDAVAIPHDNIRSLLLNSGVSFAEAGMMAYDLNWVFAENAIRQGLSVIVDAPCLYPQILDYGHALAWAHGYKYYYVELHADPGNLAMLDNRLHARVGPLRAQRTAADDVPRDASPLLTSLFLMHQRLRRMY